MTQSKQNSGNKVRRNWKVILIFVPLFAAISFFVSTIIPPKYQSQSQILILQKNMELDAYRATKASEFAAEVLKRVIGSSEFMNGVLAKTGDSPAKFGANSEDQLEEWEKSITVSTVVNTGIVKVTVLDTSKKSNQKLTEAVLSEIQDNGVRYHGNENISLKKISGPVYYDDPAFPIIWLNTLVAAVFGLFFSIGLIYLSEEKVRYWFYDDPVVLRTRENELSRLRLEVLSKESSATGQIN